MLKVSGFGKTSSSRLADWLEAMMPSPAFMCWGLGGVSGLFFVLRRGVDVGGQTLFPRVMSVLATRRRAMADAVW